MVPNKKYTGQTDRFWATVKMVSEVVGYSERVKRGAKEKKMKLYTVDDVLSVHRKLDIPTDFCFTEKMFPRTITKEIVAYLNYRNTLIEKEIQHLLMDRAQAKKAFDAVQRKYQKSKIKIQMNKQKGKKRHPSYLVNLVNIFAESVVGYNNFDEDPMRLGVVVDEKGPVKTLCRRMDGAVPSTFRPKILWEVKEYYGTTTFGSRIADGVYESLLVGEELQALERDYKIKVHHVLFVDDHYTWWQLGRSYLCRLIDMLHSEHVDAIFFGREVLDKWPGYLEEIT
jgi:hypothetical protein